ncbi:titin-like [Cydia amplana]|uniref:titin-like n=1 Tax=Cydia amplana TaxID=1869771 RepID=UPI002FE5957E
MKVSYLWTLGRGRGRQPNTPKSTSTAATLIRRVNRDKSDYKVHIIVQGSKTPSQATDASSTPSTSRAGSESETVEDKTPKADKPASTFSTPTSAAAGVYPCTLCAFTTTRLNVLILHNKTHSATYTPYTPSPVRKKPAAKPSSKATPNKTPKARKPRKEKPEKEKEKPVKKSQAQKRTTDEPPEPVEVKKAKTDEEIKSSLLADWDDMDDDDDKCPDLASSPSAAAVSPAEPTPAELPTAPLPSGDSNPNDAPAAEKPESTSDSKYEFCEDEDWSLEADAGRKIPRVKNPAKRKERKSISIDEDVVAREVADLLTRTTVPELPAVPEPLTVEQNFPEPSIVKSPDKKAQPIPESSKPTEKVAPEPPPTKAIFKTKTFFRSRHSRSQDAIGKYVAEQLNAERMDVDTELNGSEVASSPEARESPPIEPVKVARLAPKIQLKKMKAEAAQLREKEKINMELAAEAKLAANGANSKSDIVSHNLAPPDEKEVVSKSSHQHSQDVLYPTQEIKPINKDTNDSNIHDSLANEIKPIYKNILDKKSEIKEFTSNIHEPFEKEITTSNKDEPDKEIHEPITKIFNNIDTEKLDGKLGNDSEKQIDDNNLTEREDLCKTPEVAQTPCEQLVEPFMNESTASAVDALLSVSRDPDRVTKVVSDDPPEDLFEDDNKDNVVSNNVNGFDETNKDNLFVENKQIDQEMEQITEETVVSEVSLKQTIEHDNDMVAQHVDLNESNTESTCNDKMIEIPQISEETTELISETVVDSIPSESDLQIAEALINLPSTAIQNNASSQQHQQNMNLSTHFASGESFLEEVVESINDTKDNDDTMGEVRSEDNSVVDNSVEHINESVLPLSNDSLNSRYETEEEKSQNLNAAQSLVEMSECIDHKIKVSESKKPEVDNVHSIDTLHTVQATVIEKNKTVEPKLTPSVSDNSNDPISNTPKFETSSSKLLKILEEPCVPKIISKTPPKQLVVTGKEKILNFDVNKGSIKNKPQSPKQKIIIRRNTPSKNIINSINELSSPENIILSRTGKSPPDGSAMQTYTIQATPDAPPDANTIIIQQKVRKITKPAPKLQKLKQQFSLMAPVNESKPVSEPPAADDTFYDINSMPIVLSDDILTPENIEKMPIVMSDGKIITNPTNPPKLVKTKHIESEKVSTISPNKPELKTLLMNPVPEVSKATTPNILSKSSKLRASKPMLVIDKATGKQKIIMTKADPTVKEIKQSPAKLEPAAPGAAKPGKFIILPTGGSPRPNRTQKIVIDPGTGKAHVLVAKSEPAADNKPVSAKLVPQPADAGPGSTVMIITNAQGAQSRIVLTPEHEKILFPNKQQPKVSQLKTVTHRITTDSPQKTIVTSVAATKTPPPKIVPKTQKSAIITSKGQLIVGGRVATTAQNIAPMPEIRPKRRIVATEPKKLAQTVQKTSTEPLIFLQQKSGAVMQLTAAQFEHLQRTGQIVQKAPVPENKIVVQKQITIPSTEAIAPAAHKKTRRPAAMSPTPAKKLKQEIAIAPAPSPAPLPALTPLSHAAPAAHSELDNFEELLPSTAIARPASPAPAPAPAPADAPPAPLADGQLLAVPGEHFGGPPGSFYLCVEDNGSLTPIDNRPLVLENNQLVPMAEPAPAPERRDILEAALANSDVFRDPPRDDAPFRDLNANVSVHCRVSETSTTLHPIMTPVEVPSHAAAEPAAPVSLEAGLAVIGVTPHAVPTSLELPITVTDPRIAPRVSDPLAMLSASEPAPRPMSMPLLLDEEAAGRSLPMLTDEPAEEALWSRRLLTPCSDTSEASAEIPLQPAMRLSVDDLARAS